MEAHTAQELDPASVSVRRGLGWLYFYARRYDQARYHILRAIAMNPLAEESYRVLGLILSRDGRHFPEAERALRDALEMPGASAYTLAHLGYLLARAGRTDEARRILEDVTARARTRLRLPRRVRHPAHRPGRGGPARSTGPSAPATTAAAGWCTSG